MPTNGQFPVAVPVVNPALGSDLSGIGDLTPTMAEVSGRTCLAQALARRLITPRGSLIYDLNYGYDLTQWLNADVSQADVAAIQPNIVAELLKDQRVISVTVDMQWVGLDQIQAASFGTVSSPRPIPTGAFVIKIRITDGVGPFSFTLSVADFKATLLSVTS